MTLPDNRRLKNAANESIKGACCDPGKLVAFHTVIALALSLVAAAQVALYYYFKAHLDVTYAHAYMSLLPANEI